MSQSFQQFWAKLSFLQHYEGLSRIILILTPYTSCQQKTQWSQYKNNHFPNNKIVKPLFEVPKQMIGYQFFPDSLVLVNTSRTFSEWMGSDSHFCMHQTSSIPHLTLSNIVIPTPQLNLIKLPTYQSRSRSIDHGRLQFLK